MTSPSPRNPESDWQRTEDYAQLTKNRVLLFSMVDVNGRSEAEGGCQNKEGVRIRKEAG